MPALLAQAARYRMDIAPTAYRFGLWPESAEGSTVVERVLVTDGRSRRTVECDLLGASFGLIPNLELPRLLGCDCTDRGVVVDGMQRTSLLHVYAVGEVTGVAGVDAAIAEGIVAGMAAAGSEEVAIPRRVLRQRSRLRRYGQALGHAFRLGSAMRSIATPDTIVCRCEDVPLSAIDPSWSERQGRLYSRVGMGACQGRICGASMHFLRGWTSGTARPPIHPVLAATLAGGETRAPDRHSSTITGAR
jgi:NADPH-dependent 2,4-dienoyl-CoA reductase/sulfur reductase-like enzyme